jgi:hypothetical protein
MKRENKQAKNQGRLNYKQQIKKENKMITKHFAFDVYLRGKKIDTVFYSYPENYDYKEAKEEVKKSLIEHDGYDSQIKVR